ncbi:MAG TPA: type II toxin-antitoxin system RatA family toxin [Marinagarivorans sp.]
MARRLSRSAIVPFSCEQMFDLVNDVESYPHFLPNCARAVVRARSENELEAELTLAKAGLEYSFCTRNTLERPRKMALKLLTGPFKQFDGVWTFKPLANDGCEVRFDLTFSFSNRLLNMTAGKWMEDLAGEQVDVICQRAKTIYG